MNAKDIEVVREKKKEHILTLTVEFDEPVSEEEAIERVMQRLSDKHKNIAADEEPEPKKKKCKSTYKIDWDKACALKVAGWSNQEIADELHVNRGSLDSALYTHLKEYKQGRRIGRCEEDEEAEV